MGAIDPGAQGVEAAVSPRELAHANESIRLDCRRNRDLGGGEHSTSCDKLTADLEARFATRDAAHEAEMEALREECAIRRKWSERAEDLLDEWAAGADAQDIDLPGSPAEETREFLRTGK